MIPSIEHTEQMLRGLSGFYEELEPLEELQPIRTDRGIIYPPIPPTLRTEDGGPFAAYDFASYHRTPLRFLFIRWVMRLCYRINGWEIL